MAYMGAWPCSCQCWHGPADPRANAAPYTTNKAEYCVGCKRTMGKVRMQPPPQQQQHYCSMLAPQFIPNCYCNSQFNTVAYLPPLPPPMPPPLPPPEAPMHMDLEYPEDNALPPPPPSSSICPAQQTKSCPMTTVIPEINQEIISQMTPTPPGTSPTQLIKFEIKEEVFLLSTTPPPPPPTPPKSHKKNDVPAILENIQIASPLRAPRTPQPSTLTPLTSDIGDTPVMPENLGNLPATLDKPEIKPEVNKTETEDNKEELIEVKAETSFLSSVAKAVQRGNSISSSRNPDEKSYRHQ